MMQLCASVARLRVCTAGAAARKTPRSPALFAASAPPDDRVRPATMIQIAPGLFVAGMLGANRQLKVR